MASIISTLLHDGETTRRVARVLLRHVGPKDKEEATRMLYRRIGIYACDNNAITTEVEHYFKGPDTLEH
ncbi:MAG: hypothetical protein GXP02_04290 [Alphaproteobacteria bacterium]|nr:hypothetical protein [Alphaproteobacteria bacterium]